MAEEKTVKENTTDKKAEEKTVKDDGAANKTTAPKSQSDKKHPPRAHAGMRKNGRRGARRSRREEREFDQKIINIRRVTRVVAGGRRFSFSVATVIGDKKGRVGVGLGKASDTSLAINKSVNNAKKNMITLNLTKNNSIPHEVRAKFCASEVFIRPSKSEGLVAGSSVRNVLDLGGVRGANAKILSRSKNKLNNAQATVRALKKLSVSK